MKEGAVAPDGGYARELATGTQSDIDGDPVTLEPDVFTGSDRIPRRLVPLELRSHGPHFVTWDQLGKALEELVAISRKIAS